MARIITAVTFIILMTFTTVAFARQQSLSQQITLTIGTFAISADQLSYDSDYGVIRASGNVSMELKGLLQLSTPDTMELKIDRSLHTVQGSVYGRVSGQRTAADGSVHIINTSAPREGRPAFKFENRF